ncbi:1,4-alpha-glucan branching protein GlgB [Shewanella psychrotolerans]|uniref:1,4-alpha-glucan branching protein GlgB n=1 Tax=Shewanella psychrotolerans TaxID=2864206 RepID=UPI001C660843|nr:1,4-alpha-glucan branching protein GlgB [Shewanella psychrotolerans]QYK02339.1 1,4-alpha-glucan branching protein GlgB [Shewanella psychrotolerans]
MNNKTRVLIEPAAIAALIDANYTDIFALLGMHTIMVPPAKKGQDGPEVQRLVVRAFLPGALRVELLSASDGRKVSELDLLDDQGVFAGLAGRRVKPFAYRLRVHYPLSVEEIVDPYQFHSQLSADDLYLFGEGRQQQAYRFMGANWRTVDGVPGVLFCVWAPNAKRVSVVNDANHWDGRRHVMRSHIANGLWELFVPQIDALSHYKYEIESADGELFLKSDPYGKSMQAAPGNASIVPPKLDYAWRDLSWLETRANTEWHKAPVSIYEVHIGSWRRKGEHGEVYLSYKELAEQLIPYVLKQGYTHIQLMPISEFPFDGSWGYQPVGIYAPTHRFGQPHELKAFIDACHQAGIGVLLDWVAAHFPKDPHGLTRFDGSCLYEHQDPRQGEHPDWDTLIYNYGRAEVQSYLLSNAHYWLDEFHFDGLRLDAVSSMLYLDYSREPGQWLPNAYGGRENLEAITFLQDLNTRLYQCFPGIMMIAEESTAWPGVTKAVEHGGLGFGFKWNMGWMNDSLAYLSRDPLYRSHHHNQLTFSLVYSFTEQFILSLSHDEVVHGKGSLLHKIPGDDWQKFATLRAYLGFMWGHPGKKLLFMGSDFAQRDEWSHERSLDWHLLAFEPHQGVQQWVSDLNRLYRQSVALYGDDHDPQGFRWLDCDNASASVLSFIRQSDGKQLLFIVNMTPEVYREFRIGLPQAGRYRECLNSDSSYYGGSDVGNEGLVESESIAYQGYEQSACITVPPLACIVLAPDDLLEGGVNEVSHVVK